MKTTDDEITDKHAHPFAKQVWPKVCSLCKSSFTEDQWENLEYHGVQRGYDTIPDMEMRLCLCGYNMSIVTCDDFAMPGNNVCL